MHLLLFLLFAWTTARAAIDTDTKVQFDARLGYHVFNPRDLATHRYTISVGERLSLPPHWSLSAGFRAYAEGAFGANPGRYHGQVVTDESQELIPRDLFLEYKNDWLTARFGNQQVAWGETFGFYFADIVNPKDLRELGIGDLAANRLQVPMLNLKAISGNYSLQLVYIPKPYFSMIPAIGGDYAFPYSSVIPGATFVLHDDRTLPLALSNGEVGGRVTALVSGIDLSAFFLHYFDRTPSYQPVLVSPAPLTFRLDARHPRVSTFGVTATADLSPVVVRFESLYTLNRVYDAIQSGAYANGMSDEAAAVAEADYEGIAGWGLGFQLSSKHVMTEVPGAIAARTRNQVSLHAAGNVWKDHAVSAILGYALNDAGAIVEADYLVSLSGAIELMLRTELFLGPGGSEMGRYKNASRAFLLLRAFFH